MPRELPTYSPTHTAVHGEMAPYEVPGWWVEDDTYRQLNHYFYHNSISCLTGYLDEIRAQSAPEEWPDITDDFGALATPTHTFLEWLSNHEPALGAFATETVDLNSLSFKAQELFAEKVGIRRHYLRHRDRLRQGYVEAVRQILAEFRPAMLRMGQDVIPLFRTPAYKLLPDPAASIDRIYKLAVNHKQAQTGLFEALSQTLVSRHETETRYTDINHERKPPSSVSLPEDKLIDTYLKGTPLHDLFTAELAVGWTERDRFSHTHIMGRTDSGKTTLIERLIVEDIASPSRPSVVVMSPHGDIFRKLKSLPPPYCDRIIYIDAADAEFPPAMNPFSSSRPVSPNNVIKTFDFVLDALGLEFTPKQRTLWKPLIRFLTQFPKLAGRSATVVDIKDFLLKPEKYKELVAKLPDEEQEFFNEYIYAERSPLTETRKEIGYRLNEFLDDPLMRGILSAPETKLDLFQALNEGSIIFIDTAKKDLADGSKLFGGMMLALLSRAIIARDDIPENARRPTWVYVDEAANYLTSDISETLTEFRKFRCGVTLVHHYLGQATTDELRSALVSQPAIKLCRPTADDASVMAREMNCDPKALLSLPEHHFALFVTGKTPVPVPVKVDPVKLPNVSASQDMMIRLSSRARVATPKAEKKATEQPAEDEDSEWVL